MSGPKNKIHCSIVRVVGVDEIKTNVLYLQGSCLFDQAHT